ncbi:MAG: twitching motility protein [Desulfobulbus sp.]|uniref:twitching motility protein n=1 Tax=uncultured Desulfobulbus sp. TaxID=239745 RepID=UPI001B65982F|nr:twitching motility protein [uncultured Desulfobulbus sp.]MBP7517007.1 twitching motility protein [Desulfobulbus sp.]
MDLKENQAALILEASADGEITVDVQSPDSHSFASALCHALAMKLMHDEQLQAALMDMLEAGEAPGGPPN